MKSKREKAATAKKKQNIREQFFSQVNFAYKTRFLSEIGLFSSAWM
jgi:hypothetical protein